MKKWVLCLIAMALCAVLVCPVFAANDTFVPSIGYKDGPDVDQAVLEGKPVDDCLVVTSIRQAVEKSTDIGQNERDILVDIYDKLSDGSMTLPLEDKYVVRELLYVSFKETDCEEQEHGHKDKLNEPGITLTVDFDLGVNQDAQIEVLSYKTDSAGKAQWVKIEGVINNGDGTLTFLLDEPCPLAFCVINEGEIPPKTGDGIGNQLWWWVALMGVSAVAIVALTWSRFKYRR